MHTVLRLRSGKAIQVLLFVRMHRVQFLGYETQQCMVPTKNGIKEKGSGCVKRNSMHNLFGDSSS